MRASRFLPCALLLILSPLLFSSSGRDDSYLTYWPARVLATQGVIRNYNAEAVEQSSTLLHVMLIGAAARILPLPVPSIGPLLSLCFGAVTVWLTYHLARLLFVPAALPAALLAALSSSLLYWSASGMEATLAASVTLWFLLVAYRWLCTASGSYVVAFVAAFAFLSVRPENALVLAATVALLTGVWWRGRQQGAAEEIPARTYDHAPQRTPGAFFLVTVVALAALLAFRLLYFHSAFPQPVYAKGGFAFDGLARGLGYLARNTLLRPTLLLWTLCAATVIRTLYRVATQQAVASLDVLLSCFVLAYLAFVACAGGDWMEAGRFLVPVLPVVIVLAAAALWRDASTRARYPAMVVLLGLQLCDTALLFRSAQNFGGPLWRHVPARLGNDSSYSWFEHANELHAGYTDLIPALEHVIDDVRARKPGAAVSILTGQMGMVPYHVSQRRPDLVHWVDAFGLADRSVTTCPATRNLRRGPYGTVMPYEEFFRRRSAIRSLCDFADPDVIFDRAPNRDFEALLTHNGYAVVFVEKKRWLQWIAVRRDLS